ncbi:MAG: hypothetical protein ABI587_07160 [Gemmatimonadales bacterium]
MPLDLKNAPPPLLRRLAGLSLLTPRWHGILVGMGLAAAINFGLLKGWW